MLRKPLLKLALILLLGLGSSAALIWAQESPPTAPPNMFPIEQPDQQPDVTDTPTDQSPIQVTRTEPAQFTTGQAGTLSVFGANFTTSTTVRLVGIGLLQVTFVNSSALTAVLPADLAQGQYGIEVSDPGGGTVMSPNTLTVVRPPQPLPTFEPPTAFPTALPTAEPPTPIPGQPSLVVQNFSADPSTAEPGGTIQLTFVIINQGNRTAQGVSVSLDSGGKFVPANGQAGATLPDLPPGSSTQVTLNVVAAMDASEGPNSVPITMAFRDFEGKTYTSKADLSVEIAAVNEAPQVTMVRYALDPAPAAPGESVTLHLTVANTGNRPAAQVLIRIGGDKNILLAGEQGDSFPVGALQPGQIVTIDLPMVVDTAAEAGPQSQAVTISYLQGGDTKQTTTSMTVAVARVVKPDPLILLDSYNIGEGIESLTPGDHFTLSMTLRNVGLADAAELLVTFGTVDAPPSSDGSGGSSGDSSGGGSTTPSSSFAPLGAGDTLFADTLAAGSSIDLSQEFIVNSTVTSGIYSLPITVRYQKSDGTTAQQNLRASVIVLTALRLQTSLVSPIPDTVNVGEPFSVALNVANRGTNPFNVVSAAVTAENADVLDGAEMLLSPIKADKDDTINALIMPSAEGTFTVTFTLTYTDDLNREQMMVQSYNGQAVVPPPPPEMTPEVVTPTTDQPEEGNLLGRLLLGFLGLGG